MSREPSANRLRLLVVDDRRDSALILRALLERAGHDVAVVADAAIALETARQFRPHAIISDLAMDGPLDGYALARAVRGDPSLPAPVLVAVTGYSDDESRGLASDAGFDHFLVKPPAIEDLMSILDGIKS